MRMQKHSLCVSQPRADTTIVRQRGCERVASHFAGAGCAPLRVGDGRDACQVRSDGSVFFAGVRMSGESCAKIHDEQAVMMPTHRNVA
ncbi:hypothetical protein LMG27177_00915 [Paraburkholderia fynbosensis]|uniref:Uncharacterized protein n=1 Tax=Paraburkholderia fynbosensis TaxID=1200993 RepID=A0A6J5FKS7_9BURK|nr:hypothetical protein LMG27177_00915 [Paraburkholderia fynbosensis]